MEEVKWIKLIVGTRNSKSMKQLKALPDGEKMALLWYELMQLAGEINERGFLYYDNDFPYTEEMLSFELGYDIVFIKHAFDWLLKLKMISIVDNVFYLTNWIKYQNVKGLENIRERNRLYMQEYRAKKQETPLLVDNIKQEPLEIKNKGENKPMSEVFNKYGNYGWVKLKTSQYAKIKADYKDADLDKQIELLDEYIQSTGNKNKYKDWNLVLRKSLREKWFTTRGGFMNGKKEVKVPEWYDNYLSDAKEKIEQAKAKYGDVSLEDVLKDYEEK